MIPILDLTDPVAATTRIRPGQRRLIFYVAGRLGLRDEQLHDLTECTSNYRTRSISRLTIAEARRLTGLLKKIERNSRRLVEDGKQRATRKEAPA
jgi:hypothetical protein